MEKLKESQNPEALALLDRVKKGNDKLFQAWLQIRELADDKEEWSQQMDRWHEATEKLHQLCQELKVKGYTDCLYLADGQKMRRCLDNPNGFWCQVCPSIYPYWETELMELPSPKAPKPELVAEVVVLRTRKLLDTRGWCLWKCSLLDGEVIVVVKDETVVGYPKGHRVCAEAELGKMVQDNTEDLHTRDGDSTVSEVTNVANTIANAVPPPGGLITDPAEARVLVEHLARQSLIALDLETTGLDPHQAKVRLVSLATSEGAWIVDAFHVPLDGLRPALEGGPRKLCHNAKFEARFLMASGIQRPGPFFDTLLADQVLGGRSYGRSLAEVAKEYIGQELDKSQQKSDWSQTLTPEQLDYARRDAAILLGLASAQERQLEANRLSAVAELEFRALPCIAWMEQQGASFQMDDWNTLAEEARVECSGLVQELNLAARTVLSGNMFGEASVNWDSVPQVVKVLNDLGLKVADTRHETLEAFRAANPIIPLLLAYRQAAKRVGTYGADWLNYVNPATGRIHADWRQIGAETGRMACREPNLQNLPRTPRYRACFTPAPGRALVRGDYGQIELRISAQFTGDERMVTAFHEGQDLHAVTASLVLSKPLSEISPEERQMAKALNFGLIYGLGAKGLISHARNNYGVELSEGKAQEFRGRFLRAYPAVRKWQQAHGGDAESRTLLRRRRTFTEENPATWRYNTPIQGTGADILKLALAYLWETPGTEGTFPVLVIHDEIVVETSAERIQDAEAWLRSAMERAGAEILNSVPAVVETKIENTQGGA